MIVLFGGVVQPKGRGLYIIRGGVGCSHAAAIEVVGDGIVGGRPLGVELYRTSVGIGEVLDALAVFIGSAVAVGIGVPAGEGVVRAAEGVGGEVLGFIVSEGLVIHLAIAAGAAVAVERESVHRRDILRPRRRRGEQHHEQHHGRPQVGHAS